jgi:hypothetical protein
MDRLTDAEINSINKKHKRIRGTPELKYPPKESRCRLTCGISGHDWWADKFTGKQREGQHRCFLAIGHRGDCEFSSECTSQIQVVTGVAA